MKKRFKKIGMITLSTGVLVGGILPVVGHASGRDLNHNSVIQYKKINDVIQDNNVKYEQNKLIDTIKPYVHLNSDGTLKLVNVPEYLYKRYNLSLLQEHFNQINEGVQNNTLVVTQNLEVIPTSVQLKASYKKWTNHWWGYDRKFTHASAIQYQTELNSVASGAGIVTALTAWFPPLSELSGVSSAYWYLLSSRVAANDHGHGVYVGVTWVNVFNVEPL